MLSFFDVIALLTAGMALATGLIGLATGLHKDGEKLNLIFGIMSLCLFCFFLTPPVGFILEDKAPYSWDIIVKRVFNFSFSALLPWFICAYTGYRKKVFPSLISICVFITYLTMCFTYVDSAKPLWAYFVLVCLALTNVFGFYAAYFQYKNADKIHARWFLSAMAIYSLFFVLTAVNQVGDNYFGQMLGVKLFFPLNLFPLAFIVIMSLRLTKNILEKYRVEKLLHHTDEQWKMIIQSMQLLIIELDKNGSIGSVNPYALKLLGYTNVQELLNKNWFDLCLPKDEVTFTRSIFTRLLFEQNSVPCFTGNILSKDGSVRIINWTNVLMYNESREIKGSLSIGVDITEQERAIEEASILKNELEKENLLFYTVNDTATNGEIIGNCEAIGYAIQKAKQVANTNVAVLLLGETGVGKDMFATLIHRYSYRSDKAIIRVNCAALPPDLIESELFGHEKGAFTGALQTRKGRFEMADGGTIFLDEIGELPLSLQPKLLRVLQNGEFERIGGQQTIKVDVRVISATNRNLSAEVKTSHFREDLFYRLNVFPITIPALRNRKEDIPLLVGHFVNKYAAEHRKEIGNISKADMSKLIEYAWPGNIREMINIIERSIISTQGNTLKIDWKGSIQEDAPEGLIASSIEEVERLHILKVLKESRWRINGDDGAAEKLQLHPNTLRSRMKKLNIKRIDS